jgi:hypothetical protein
MKERIFPFIIALSALSVSASAAFYSVFGLSHLFAGASTQVIIMAGALEVAKLVVASLLYQYWDKINKLLRAYFVIATFILMVITSGGIYGYLSGAYQETATQSEFLDRQVLVIEQKQVRFEEQKSDLKIEKSAIVKTISDLRVSLSNPAQVSYYDKEAEKVITTTSSSARRALQAELKTAIIERDNIDLRLNAVTDSIAALDVNILDAQINNESARELGPLKYMAELTGQPMSKIVNWFMMLIIFVFDPLAIAMVVAANMAFAHVKGVSRDPKDYEVYQKEERTPEQIKEDYIKAEGDLSGPRMKPKNNIEKQDSQVGIPSTPEERISTLKQRQEYIKMEEKLQKLGEAIDRIEPKESPIKVEIKTEKPTPKDSSSSPWGTPGGARKK